MKKAMLIVMALLVTSLGVSAQASARANVASRSASATSTTGFKVYGIAFYNLENLFDTINANGNYDLEFSPEGKRNWTGDRYRAKINNLATAIAALKSPATPDGPAIIGVAEVENSAVVEDLVSAAPLSGRRLAFVHHDSPDRRGIDVSLLYDPEQFTVVDVTNHTLHVASDPDLLTRDQMCVTGLLDGDTISVIVNHWPSRLGGQEASSPLREAAAALSKHIADSLWAIRPDQGIIIMGDLNDDPFDRSCSEVLGARRKAMDAGPHGFFNPWWKILDDGMGTLTYNGEWNLFDQIIVSGTLLSHNNPRSGRLTYWRCRIGNFDFLRDRTNRLGGPLRTYSRGQFLNGYSDHFPTEIYLIKRL